MRALAAIAMMATMTAASHPGDIEAQIRAARARSNAAIARHDLSGMRAVFAPDYHVLPGSSGMPSGLDAFDARIGATFADPTFDSYVRTPATITVAGSGRRAAEVGTWEGRWRKSGRDVRVTGIYQAMWVPTAAGWRLLNESFITLGCAGPPDACAALG